MRLSQVPTLPESWAPTGAPGGVEPAPDPRVLIVDQPPKARHAGETKMLAPIAFPLPDSLDNVFEGHHGSAAGFHAVSESLTCPTKRMLHQAGVKKKGEQGIYDFNGKIESRSYGTLIHTILAVRIVHGQTAAEHLFVVPNGTNMPDFGPVGKDLGLEDLGRVMTILKTYDAEYPLIDEPFNYILVEQEVATDIGDGQGGSALRTVIYDAVVQSKERKVVYSLEKKTSSRAGSGAMDPYMPQFAVQCAVWNANPHLLEQYGPMMGVIPDVIVKTTVPKCERYGVRYISRFMQTMAVRYMRLPDTVRYPSMPGPSGFPMYLHACWGRFERCEYIGACWEGSYGEYEWPENSNQNVGQQTPEAT